MIAQKIHFLILFIEKMILNIKQAIRINDVRNTKQQGTGLGLASGRETITKQSVTLQQKSFQKLVAAGQCPSIIFT